MANATPEVMGRMLYASPRDLFEGPFVRVTETLDQLDVRLKKIKL